MSEKAEMAEIFMKYGNGKRRRKSRQKTEIVGRAQILLQHGNTKNRNKSEKVNKQPRLFSNYIELKIQ